MQLLRVFSIIIALVFIIASSNISFKSVDDDNNSRIDTKAPLIDSIHLYIDDKSTFSSLLQAISAQEQEQHEVDQEDNGNDSDSAMEREEGQDRADGERESSMGQEQEQQDIEKQQEQDEIKEDCGPTEHFDSEVDSCISDQEKVCNDDRDNDSRVDSEDSDCLSNKDDHEQQDNIQKDKEKLIPGEEEEQPSLVNKQDNNSGENPVPIEQQQENNTSSDSFVTEDKAQNIQNSTDSHSKETTTSNNNASLNEFHHANTSAAEEAGFALNCHPAEAEMLPGEEDSIICTIENKTPKPIEMVLGCSGLQDTGIECYINGESLTGRTLIKEMSDTDFSVLIVSRSSPPVPAGSYPFTISAEECINSDLC